MTTALTDLSDIEIKRAVYSPECAQNIAYLCRECFTDAWSLASVSEMLSAEQNAVFCADNGKVGFVGASVAGDVADILDVAVMPDYRKKGIGKKLLRTLIDELTHLGVCEVFLEVRASNSAAISLYTSFGFEKCGERKSYYSSPREDALLYKLSIRM